MFKFLESLNIKKKNLSTKRETKKVLQNSKEHEEFIQGSLIPTNKDERLNDSEKMQNRYLNESSQSSNLNEQIERFLKPNSHLLFGESFQIQSIDNWTIDKTRTDLKSLKVNAQIAENWKNEKFKSRNKPK